MNFEVGKKYHVPNVNMRNYFLVRDNFWVRGINYLTVIAYSKKDNSLEYVVTWKTENLSQLVPYVKTREVTHERWPYFLRNKKDGQICCYISETEIGEDVAEKNNLYWEFLKCEKITYTEIVNEE